MLYAIESPLGWQFSTLSSSSAVNKEETSQTIIAKPRIFQDPLVANQEYLFVLLSLKLTSLMLGHIKKTYN